MQPLTVLRGTDENKYSAWLTHSRSPGVRIPEAQKTPALSAEKRVSARSRDDNIRQHLLKKHMEHSALISYLYYLVSNAVGQAYYVKKHMYMKMLVFCFLT